MAVTNTANIPGGTISISSNSVLNSTFTPSPGLTVKDEDGVAHDILAYIKHTEDLQLQMEAMREHIDELTEENGYTPSMTLKERIEAKRFLKKLSGN